MFRLVALTLCLFAAESRSEELSRDRERETVKVRFTFAMSIQTCCKTPPVITTQQNVNTVIREAIPQTAPIVTPSEIIWIGGVGYSRCANGNCPIK